jgi:hypothetical protein
MLTGYLHKIPDTGKWVIRYKTEKELPVHSKDAELLMKADDEKPVFFEVETVAVGTSEHDVTDCDVAKIVHMQNLYSEIEHAIIDYTNSGRMTAGELTRQIMKLIEKNNQ